MRKFRNLSTMLVLLGIYSLHAANVSIPLFELSTFGTMKNGSLGLSTNGRMDVRIEGGYKFGGNIVLGMDSTDIAKVLTPEDRLARALIFKSAGVTVKEIFSLPVDLTYFIGQNDTFCSGGSFPSLFGTDVIASAFHGPLYFRDGVQYEGIHTVHGTGIALGTQPLLPWLRLFFYGYQDAFFGSGIYSMDFRSMMNFENLKIESFVGISFPVSSIGAYRTGILFFYDIGTGGEFLAQLGIPYWDPASRESFTQDHIFFLFEPRLNFGDFSIIASLFKYPKYYNQVITGEANSYNLNFNFIMGNRTTSPVSGGIETNMNLRPNTESKIAVRLFPYFRLVSSGVIWDFRLGAKLFPFDANDLIEGYIGIQTEF